MKDLFGIEEEAPQQLSKKKGHAGIVGTGPIGETCKTCSSCTYTDKHSRGRFYKCLLTRKNWTHGPGSDIRLKDPACSYWTDTAARPEAGLA